MLDSSLQTFISVADQGSFGKAAEQLYLSANSVKKRINHMEACLGFRLFERTSRGVSLTSAGESFYGDAKILLQSYAHAVERAKRAQNYTDDIIRIGMMESFADEFMLARWVAAHKEYNGRTRLVFYGSDSGAMLRSLGRDIDIAINLYDPELAENMGLSAVQMSELRILCGVPADHRLADRERISPPDLSNEVLMVLKQGRFPVWDSMRKELRREYPDAIFEDIDAYSIKTFNRCESQDKCILLTEVWEDIYPFLKYIPFEREYSVPFGMYHVSKPPARVHEFIKYVSMTAASEQNSLI